MPRWTALPRCAGCWPDALGRGVQEIADGAQRLLPVHAARLEALHERRDITHIKIEDGQGRKLGRHFKVKLWPTLVVLRQGQEIGRVTRPQSAQEVEEQLPVAV
mgnify:CR=1 FL=1